MRDEICGLSSVKHLPSGKPEWGNRSVVSGVRILVSGPAYAWVYHMFESQAHLAVWTALLFFSFVWRKKQAVEIDPMQTSAGWLAGELRPPKQ
jgi:hypothetical protein